MPLSERSQTAVSYREVIGGGRGGKQQPDYKKRVIELWVGGEHSEDQRLTFIRMLGRV